MAVETCVYQIKYFIRRISPMIWRRILVRSDSSLEDLHEIIQLSMGWDADHLYCFKVNGKDYGSAGALTGDEHEPLSALRLRPNQRFLYEYDFTTMFDGWQFDVRFERDLPLKNGVNYPHCLGGKRYGPPERCSGAREFVDEQYRIERTFLCDLVEAWKAKDIDAMRDIYEENNFYSRETLNRTFSKHFQTAADKKRSANEV